MKALIPYFIHQQWLKNRMSGSGQGFAMFLDLTGFTALTETLMQQGVEGAEELSHNLNSIFEPMVQLVYAKGGIIPYFAGDAFTALFFDETPQLGDIVLETAHQLIHAYEDKGLRETQFGQFQIGLKVGIGYGDIQWGIVGDELHASYFKGSAIDIAAECQIKAKDRLMVVHEQAAAHTDVKKWGLLPLSKGYYTIDQLVDVPPLQSIAPIEIPKMEVDTLRHFLPEQVLHYDQSGEFRDVVAIFMAFKGVSTHKDIATLSEAVINRIAGYSGYFKEIDFGDKGSVMVAFFGAPVAFENNIDRALTCMLSLQYDIRELQKQQLPRLKAKCGIAAGQAFTGIVGGRERCQYAVVGNRVNVAARLMTKADWGEIWVDENVQKQRYFHFAHRGNIQYKGMLQNVPTYQLLGRQKDIQEEYDTDIIGRQTELRQMKAFANDRLTEGNAGYIYLFGEAGIGKSRLSHELEQMVAPKHFQWLLFQADQILQKPYNVFIYFLLNFFDQSPERSVSQNRTTFEKVFDEFVLKASKLPQAETHLKELKRTKPVLAALIGAPYTHSLWDLLDAKGKSVNTRLAIVNLLTLAVMQKPTVFEMEDAHWFDERSTALLHELMRKLAHDPVLFLFTSRPNDSGENVKILDPNRYPSADMPSIEINLQALSKNQLKQYAESQLKGPIHEEFLTLLQKNTNGNPFYMEQLIEFLIESDALERSPDGSWNVIDNEIKLSSSINNILTARIDRLSGMVKETVKAAAVIGREFDIPVLSEVMRHQYSVNDGTDTTSLWNALREQVDSAEQGQIWRALNELRYIFRHSLLREAAYSMQLRTRLREVHKLIAQAIEKLYQKHIEERYVDLAFHYEHAEDEEKTRFYLDKAADYFKDNYQNEDALRYYDKYLMRLPEHNVSERCKTLLKKAKILRDIGNWDECEKIATLALQVAQQSKKTKLIGRAQCLMGHYLMLSGNYPQAQDALQNGLASFEKCRDEKGILRISGHLGELYFRQGNYDLAKSFFMRCLDMNEAAEKHYGSMAQIAANLGLTFMNQGMYEEGIRYMQDHLDDAKQMNDKLGSATLYTNLGIVYAESNNYDEALQCYELGLRLSRELGNKQLQAIAIGSLGAVHQERGEYALALDLYEQDLQICNELGDKQGISIVHGLLGELHSIQGDFQQAIRHLEANLHLSTQLGYRKGSAKALNTLGDIRYATGDFATAIDNYEKAIEIARSINNKLILGNTLVEMGKPLVAMNRLQEAKATQQEALQIGREIDNKELVFESLILHAIITTAEGNSSLAYRQLEELIQQADTDFAEASVYYYLWKVHPDDTAIYQRALKLYRSLHSAAPTFLINQRLAELLR